MGFEFGKTNYDSVSCFVYFLLRKMISDRHQVRDKQYPNLGRPQGLS